MLPHSSQLQKNAMNLWVVFQKMIATSIYYKNMHYSTLNLKNGEGRLFFLGVLSGASC